MTILKACTKCDFEEEEFLHDVEAEMTIIQPRLYDGEVSVYDYLHSGEHLRAGLCGCGGRLCIMEANA